MSNLSEINFDELPTEVLSKIPFSIRTKKKIYNISELPIEIQYLLEKYYEQKVPEIEYNLFYDGKFEISPYSDFGIYTSLKEYVLDLFKHYLLIRVGSYPYDVSWGCQLKDQVQMKDTSLRKEIIGNELALICGVLGNDYNMKIKAKYTINKVQNPDNVEYVCKIVVQIDDIVEEISI